MTKICLVRKAWFLHQNYHCRWIDNALMFIKILNILCLVKMQIVAGVRMSRPTYYFEKLIHIAGNLHDHFNCEIILIVFQFKWMFYDICCSQISIYNWQGTCDSTQWMCFIGIFWWIIQWEYGRVGKTRITINWLPQDENDLQTYLITYRWLVIKYIIR